MGPGTCWKVLAGWSSDQRTRVLFIFEQIRSGVTVCQIVSTPLCFEWARNILVVHLTPLRLEEDENTKPGVCCACSPAVCRKLCLSCLLSTCEIECCKSISRSGNQTQKAHPRPAFVKPNVECSVSVWLAFLSASDVLSASQWLDWCLLWSKMHSQQQPQPQPQQQQQQRRNNNKNNNNTNNNNNSDNPGKLQHFLRRLPRYLNSPMIPSILLLCAMLLALGQSSISGDSSATEA